MRGTRRAENFASEAVFELYWLIIDDHLFGAGRRPTVGRVATGHCKKRKRTIGKCLKTTIYNTKTLKPLTLNISRLVGSCSWNDARIGEAGAQQCAHDKNVKNGGDDRNGPAHLLRQVRTAVRTKKIKNLYLRNAKHQNTKTHLLVIEEKNAGGIDQQ